MQWDWAIELGRWIERTRRLETDVRRLDTKIDDLMALIRRVGLLIALWGSALILVLSTDRGADVVAKVIKGLL